MKFHRILTIHSLALFALQVSRKWPYLIDREALVIELVPVGSMLEKYPYVENLGFQVQQQAAQLIEEMSSDSRASNDGGASGGGSNSGVINPANGLIFDATDTLGFDFGGIDLFLAPGYLENFDSFVG